MKKLLFLIIIIISACNASKKEKQIEESAKQVIKVIDGKQQSQKEIESDVVEKQSTDTITKITSEKTQKTIEIINETFDDVKPEIIKKHKIASEVKIEIKDTTVQLQPVVEKETIKEQVPEIKEVVKKTKEPKKNDHQQWTDFLKKYVNSNGDVNYTAINANESELKDYLNQFVNNPPKSSWSKNEKLAYWINAYNAFTIKLIVDNYPIKSIKDIKNPWDKKFIPIDGTLISLNHIEHDILRKMNEPRIHFAINCASFSCPKLLNEAFEAGKLESQLTKVTKGFINNSKKNSLTKDEVKISKIFKWFNKDFEKKGTIVDFLNTYSDVTIDSDAKIGYLDYNWNLNKQ